MSFARRTHATLQQLCAQKHEEGYEWASFTHKTDFSGFKPVLTVSDKPHDALFFSPLLDVGEHEYEPHWFAAHIDDDYVLQHCAKRPIVFAKLRAGAKILAQNDPLLKRYMTRLTRTAYDIQWPFLQLLQYQGIEVRPNFTHGDPFSSWEVPTLAVWDASALTAVQFFEPAGADFTYLMSE